MHFRLLKWGFRQIRRFCLWRVVGGSARSILDDVYGSPHRRHFDKPTAANAPTIALLAALGRATVSGLAKHASGTCNGAAEMIRSFHTCVHKPTFQIQVRNGGSFRNIQRLSDTAYGQVARLKMLRGSEQADLSLPILHPPCLRPHSLPNPLLTSLPWTMARRLLREKD